MTDVSASAWPDQQQRRGSNNTNNSGNGKAVPTSTQPTLFSKTSQLTKWTSNGTEVTKWGAWNEKTGTGAPVQSGHKPQDKDQLNGNGSNSGGSKTDKWQALSSVAPSQQQQQQQSPAPNKLPGVAVGVAMVGPGSGGGGGVVPSALTSSMSLSTLRRRLSEIGTNLPAIKAKKKIRPLLLPQRKVDQGKLTVILDMDETLIHSEFTGTRDYRQAEERQHAKRKPDFSIKLYEDDPEQEEEIVHVYKRPGLDEFLERLAEICEPVIFTAALPLYARPILKHIDPKRLCKSRLYRNATIKYKGYPHVKSLKRLGRDLRRTVLVDNSPYAMCADPYNAYLIKSFYDDEEDRELDKLFETILEIKDLPDVRPFMHKTFNFKRLISSQAEE